MKSFAITILLFALLEFTSASYLTSAYGSLETVPEVDLNRYQGIWYEIAHIPFFFEKDCHCSIARYTVTPDESVKIQNTCNWKKPNGKLAITEAEAWPLNSTKSVVTEGKFEMTYTTLFSVPYWVLALDKDYQYVLAGTPFLQNMWILSRTPTIQEEVYDALLEDARRQGFDVSQVTKTYHGPECNELYQKVLEGIIE